ALILRQLNVLRVPTQGERRATEENLMAGGIATPRVQAAEGAPASTKTYRSALILLASLFFMWGFATVLNNTLLPHLKAVFDFNYTQATLIESVWFIAYFVASIPSAKLIEAIGYKRSMVVGLVIMAGGALLMIPAAATPS